jgi:hypothetical protein
MIIAVTGGRYHVVTDKEAQRFWDTMNESIREFGMVTLRHGAARGVDSWCAEWGGCSSRITVEAWPANWRRDGRAWAGRRRNRAMLEGPPRVGLLIAFPGNEGTHHCVSVAGEIEIPVEFI